MSAELALSLDLVARGNARLSHAEVPALIAGAGTALFCESIRFSKDERTELAADPKSFFERLARAGVSRLALRRIARPDGFGRMVLECAGLGAFAPAWSLGDRTRADQRIWQVRYLLTDEPLAPQITDLARAQRLLEEALDGIAAFATRERLAPFDQSFWRARELLRPEAALDGSRIPVGLLAPAAHRLATAALTAWVFGGMGSWNDLGWDDHPEYRRWTNALYPAIFDALEASTAGP